MLHLSSFIKIKSSRIYFWYYIYQLTSKRIWIGAHQQKDHIVQAHLQEADPLPDLDHLVGEETAAL